MQESPLFPITNSCVRSYRSYTEDPMFNPDHIQGDTVNQFLGTTDHYKLHVVNSIDDAEDLLIKSATQLSITLRDNCWEQDFSNPAIILDNQIRAIRKASNLIAAKTRRSIGNIALLNQSTVDRLIRYDASIERVKKTTVGRWRHVAKNKIGSQMNFYSSPDIPDNIAVIVYVNKLCLATSGIHDGPAILVDDNNSLTLMTLDSRSCYLGDFKDYIINLQLPTIRV